MLTSLTHRLKAHARQLGFDLVGICDARPFVQERAYLEERTRRGIQPNPFESRDLEARTDPEHVLPGVRSIVAVGMSYLVADEASAAATDRPSARESEAPALRGWLSRYCRGRDYHSVIGERLAQLGAWLEEQVPDSRALVHVDTGAPLDRAIAQRAGLGRFGKSTNLIARGFGTWTFLGEMLTSVALTPDQESTWNVCGTCTRCLDACPTQCLTPWEIDSTRCLGFVNQSSGDIPAAFRSLMGNRLFGCDDCQDVCPYNRAAVSGRHPEFAPASGTPPGVDLIRLLQMRQAEFDQVIGPTAAAWRGLKTLQRNALVALGNSGDPRAFEALVARLSDPSPRLRVHAAWGTGRLAWLLPELAAAAAEALSARLAVEPDPHVRDELARALADLAGSADPPDQQISMASPKLKNR